ncbi:hypothetical protein [Hymenobacter sp. BT491]|uniref:hypothetical protein n=1 Tax=Hymenobacter sp. BT491 TaxID=2766779 RepID=UPI0016534E55|nr:hypothetical protein [Hymenobacter sp. BT491]MBC6991628.1 hypothetical protein [Hymenobacter sp. BT491]
MTLLLSTCQPALEPGPRLSFVSNARYNTGNRVVSSPGDTLTTKIYARAADDDSPLQRVRILVKYQPRKEPIVYPNAYNPLTDPLATPEAEFVYMDSVLSPQSAKEFSFQHTFGIRTTSGQETWTYEATDANTTPRTASKSFRLTMRNLDSALTYHRYTIRLQSPRNYDSRRFLYALAGLAFPKFSVFQNPAIQGLIDFVYVPNSDGTISLASPTDAALKIPWATKRATELGSTKLTETEFSATDTPAKLLGRFTEAVAFPTRTRTGALVKGQVIAFRTAGAEPKPGLLLVQDIVTTPFPALVVQIRIAK